MVSGRLFTIAGGAVTLAPQGVSLGITVTVTAPPLLLVAAAVSVAVESLERGHITGQLGVGRQPIKTAPWRRHQLRPLLALPTKGGPFSQRTKGQNQQGRPPYPKAGALLPPLTVAKLSWRLWSDGDGKEKG